jgi:hypothetical protein
VKFRFLCLSVLAAAASLAIGPQAHASLVHAHTGNSLPQNNPHAGGSGAGGFSGGSNQNSGGGNGGSGGFGGSFIGGGLGGLPGGGFFGGSGSGGLPGGSGDSHGGGPRTGNSSNGNGAPGDHGPNDLAGNFPKGGSDPDPWHGDSTGPGGPNGPGGGGWGDPTNPGDGPPISFFGNPLSDPGNDPLDTPVSLNDPVDVPETSSLALFAAALLGFCVWGRRRSRPRP